MSTVLSKGYKLPQTGDKGFWADLESNIQLNNSHSHNGTDGERIAAKDLTKASATILGSGFAAVSGQDGTFSQTITLPTGFLMSTVIIKFVVSGGADDGQPVYLTVKPLTTTTYDVYTNTPSENYTVIYA